MIRPSLSSKDIVFVGFFLCLKNHDVLRMTLFYSLSTHPVFQICQQGIEILVGGIDIVLQYYFEQV